MKQILMALFFMCATAALGQSVAGIGAMSAQTQPLVMPNHPEHASYHSMGQEQGLLKESAYCIQKGVRPLWEVQPAKPVVPLGDVARMLKEQHAMIKQSEFVWVN